MICVCDMTEHNDVHLNRTNDQFQSQISDTKMK